MPAKNLLRVSEKGTYSHIYNKGIENKFIFNDAHDYEVFLGYLQEYLSPVPDHSSSKKAFTVNGRTYQGTPHLPKNYFKKVELIAYTLLPDHFHLVLHQIESGSIERLMRSLSTRYSMYFNKRYQRSGSLFEGPYKSVQINNLKSLVVFIAQLSKMHTNSPYSSNAAYLTGKADPVVQTSSIKNYFSSTDNDENQAIKTYSEYAEKHIFTLEEKQAFAAQIIETKKQSLERRDPITSPTITEPNPLKVPFIPQQADYTQNSAIDSRPSRIPEYIGLSLSFVLLFGLGLRNISVTSLRANEGTNIADTHISAPSEVESQSYAVTTLFSEPGEANTVLSATISGQQADNQTLPSEPSDLLFKPVQVIEDFIKVNIYNDPSTDSAIHRTAKAGEFFEGYPVNENWYEVRLGEHTSGYIEMKHIKLQQNIAQ